MVTAKYALKNLETRIKAETLIKILSANGSNVFPHSVTKFLLRAREPSTASENDEKKNRIRPAIYCSVNKRYPTNGMVAKRNQVIEFGVTNRGIRGKMVRERILSVRVSWVMI